MTNLRNLAPWAIFAIGSVVVDWRTAAAAALAACVLNAVARRRAAERADEMAVAAMALFGAFTVLGGVAPGSSIGNYVSALTAAAIGSAMVASVLRGRPFTLPFAKRSTPPEIWDDPRFLHANAVISLVWATSVLAMAAALAMLRVAEPHAVLAAIAVQVAGFVLPMRFTTLYRARLRTRFALA